MLNRRRLRPGVLRGAAAAAWTETAEVRAQPIARDRKTVSDVMRVVMARQAPGGSVPVMRVQVHPEVLCKLISDYESISLAFCRKLLGDRIPSRPFGPRAAPGMTRLRLKQIVFVSWALVLASLIASVFYRTAPLVNSLSAVRIGDLFPLIEPVGGALVQQLAVMGPMLIPEGNDDRVDTTTSWIIVSSMVLYAACMMIVIVTAITTEQLTMVHTTAGGLAENAEAIGIYQRWLMPRGLFPIALLYTAKEAT